MDGELRDLERAGWEALATSGEAAQAFYEPLLTDDARMVFPGGVVLRGKPAIVQAMGGPPWAAYALSDVEVTPLSPDAAIVSYTATAHRTGDDEFRANCTSVYVRPTAAAGGWQLALHQHTPA